MTTLQTVAGLRHRSLACGAGFAPCFLGRLGFRALIYPTPVEECRG